MRKVLLRLFFSMGLPRAILLKKIFGIGYVCRMMGHCNPRLTRILLRHYRARIGENVHLKSPLWIDNAGSDEESTGDFSKLEIGDHCYIGSGVFFDLVDRIVLEEASIISAGARFITHEDTGGRPLSKWYPRKRAPIRIGRGTWVGAGATILHGVELGPCCVVAAGAVVLDSFPEKSVIAGIPARLVKTLEG